MIAITLNFKSLESALKALLEIPQSALADDEPVVTSEAKPVAAKSEHKAKPEPKKVEPAAEKAPAKTEPPAEAQADAPAEAIEYPVLQKAVFALAGKSRDEATKLVAAFGVKTFKELPADKWSEALAAVNAKLAELEAA